MTACPAKVRSYPESGAKADIPASENLHTTGLMRCSKNPLLDYLVGAQQQRRRDKEADGSGSFEIEHELKDRRLLNWKIGRRGAAEDLDERPVRSAYAPSVPAAID